MTGLGRGEDRPPMYGMEELVPLVGKLADRYNGYEDTSVTYEKAQQLLDKTDLAISAVAAEVGFDNFSYFARLFRRRVGMNPQEYRRQCAKRDKG